MLKCLTAVLRDARHFLLPDKVKINGLWQDIKDAPKLGLGSALQRRQECARAEVIAKWPGFDAFMENLVAEALTFDPLVAGAAASSEVSSTLAGKRQGSGYQAYGYPKTYPRLGGEEPAHLPICPSARPPIRPPAGWIFGNPGIMQAGNPEMSDPKKIYKIK